MMKNSKKGGEKKRINMVYKEIAPYLLIVQLKHHLKVFIAHNFRAQWQYSKFKECLANIPNNVVVLVIDFAENYTFQI